MGSLHKYIQLMLEFFKTPFLVLHFSYYTLITFLTTVSVILLSMLMVLLIFSVWSDVWSVVTTGTAFFWTWIWSARHCGLGQKVACWCQWWKTQLVSFEPSNNSGVIDVKLDRCVLEKKKSSFSMMGLTFFSKLDWGSYIISIAKTTCKKVRELIRSMKFLSPEVALYLFISTIRPCMEYYCYVCVGAPSCYLELLDKRQKRICRIVSPSLATSS